MLYFSVDQIYHAAPPDFQCFVNGVSQPDSGVCDLDSKTSYEWSAWEDVTANPCGSVSRVVITRQQIRACYYKERLNFLTKNDVSADCDCYVVKSLKKRAVQLQKTTNSRMQAIKACQAVNSTLFTGSYSATGDFLSSVSKADNFLGTEKTVSIVF